ncbi:unnamed protein product [Scytosiphon promiscuus]
MGSRKALLLVPVLLLPVFLGALLLPLIFAQPCEHDVLCAKWWKEYLSSSDGLSWFDPWNPFMQAKLDVMAAIAEQRGHDKTEPFRVLMVGDSTMSHQFGAMCAFIGEREGRRFDPEYTQKQSPGCCMDTLPKEEGGGRGLCFEYDYFRFLDPKRPARTSVDVYYFGSGLHLLHMFPRWPEFNPMAPLRVQSWLNYESLLEGVVEGAREANGPDAMVVFNTNHAIADELFEGDYKAIHEAYRVGEGNATIRAECQGDNNAKVRAAATADPNDFRASDWHAYPEVAKYMTYPEGQGLFTVDTYCEEAILDRRGSLQLSRRARPVMSRLGVPMVDSAKIVEGQGWASSPSDGRHFHKLVPLEVTELLSLLGAPPPPGDLPDRGQPAVTSEAEEPALIVDGGDGTSSQP